MPPIPGVIVIPGDIGFLNQFFSVMLMVGNVAPAGSNLVVSDLTRGDRPAARATTRRRHPPTIRCAWRAPRAARRRASKPSSQPGADGKLGTADDIADARPGRDRQRRVPRRRPPRRQPRRRDGDRTARCTACRSARCTIRGRAAGAVLVRNPTFTLTFTHPEVVSAGEPYTLDVTVTNTSESPANFVSLNLLSAQRQRRDDRRRADARDREHPAGRFGDGQLRSDLADHRQGDRRDARLRRERRRPLRAEDRGRRAGRAAVARFAGAAEGSSPLPKALRDAAIGLLGKAWAVATAPAAALPRDVQRFSKKIVIDRAVEVAEAGFRVTLHEPLRRQRRAPRDGLHRQQLFAAAGAQPASRRPRVRAEQLPRLRRAAAQVDSRRRLRAGGRRPAAPDLASHGAAAFHASWRRRLSYRPAHISVLVGGSGGILCPSMSSIVDAQGRRLGGVNAQGKVVKEIPFAICCRSTNAGGAVIAPDWRPGRAAVRAPSRSASSRSPARAGDAPFSAQPRRARRAGGSLRHVTFENVDARARCRAIRDRRAGRPRSTCRVAGDAGRRLRSADRRTPCSPIRRRRSSASSSRPTPTGSLRCRRPGFRCRPHRRRAVQRGGDAGRACRTSSAARHHQLPARRQPGRRRRAAAGTPDRVPRAARSVSVRSCRAS